MDEINVQDEDRKITRYIMSPDGDIEDVIYEGQAYKKIDKEEEARQKNYAREHVVDFNDDASFVKLFDEVINPLRKYLTPTEFTFAISLARFVSYEDCVLRTGAHGNGKIMNTTDIAKEMRIPVSTVKRIVSALVDKGVLGRHEVGTILDDKNGSSKRQYTVNPYIYCRGKDIVRWVVNFYDSTGWRERINEERDRLREIDTPKTFKN